MLGAFLRRFVWCLYVAGYSGFVAVDLMVYDFLYKDYCNRIPVLKQWVMAYKKSLDMGIDLK